MRAFQSSPLLHVTDELLEDEVVALSSYKDFSYQLNGFLRGNKDAVAPDPNRFPPLDSAIRKRCFIQNVCLYRATFAEDFDRFVRDCNFNDPAYASTSLNASTLGRHFVSASHKHPIKLVISCPKGANAFFLEIANDSSESESEFLLPRSSRYHIDNVSAPITGANRIAIEIGQSNKLHANDFNSLRIINLTLLGA